MSCETIERKLNMEARATREWIEKRKEELAWRLAPRKDYVPRYHVRYEPRETPYVGMGGGRGGR